MMRLVRPRPGRSSEEGAAATMVILGIVALLGAALVAIDGGSVLHTRRGLIADTDAAALATASELLDDRCASDTVARGFADTMAAANSAATTVIDVEVDRYGNCTAGHGLVRVSTTHPASLFFAPVFGIDQFEAGAASTAAYGRVQALEGLRPIGLCGTEVHYQAWRNLLQVLRTSPDTDDAAAQATYDGLRGSGPEYPAMTGAGVVHKIPFQRLGLGGCASLGSPAGNWGWLDFDGGGNSNADLDRWIEDGYDGEVDLGGPIPGDESCDDTAPGYENCESMPGGRGASTRAALNSISCPPPTATSDCFVFYGVVYDQISGSSNGGGGNGNGGGGNGNGGGGNGNGGGGNGNGGGGNGANTRYHPASFAGVVLRGHDLGTGQAFGNSSWIAIEFVDELTHGKIGASSPADPFPGPRGVQLCATEAYDDC